jgi:hypothetical protein
MLYKLFTLFATDYHTSRQKREEAWLSKSIDLIDLESRQRQLIYGQTKNNLY